MSVVPGETLKKDPDAELVYTFDWTLWLVAAEIDDYTVLITGPDNALTQDNDSVDAGNQMVSVRLLGGTAGKQYTLTCRITTDEAVPQTDDRSVTIWVRER